MKPVLFYTIGYPGAGKTTLAARLSSWLGGAHLRGDVIGLELFRIPTYSPQERQMVYAEMNRRAAAQLAAGKHVLYDASANTVAQRAQVAQLAHNAGTAAVGLWVQTPLKLAKQRAAAARDQGIAGRVVRIIPPHVFDQYIAAFEAPRAGEQIVIIPGDAPFHQQYRQLRRQLDGPALPRLIQ